MTIRPLCRQVCNHPFLFDEYKLGTGNEFLIRSCGKLAILDRILPKLQVCAVGQAACMCSLPLLCVSALPRRVAVRASAHASWPQALSVCAAFFMCGRGVHVYMDACRFPCTSDSELHAARRAPGAHLQPNGAAHQQDSGGVLLHEAISALGSHWRDRLRGSQDHDGQVRALCMRVCSRARVRKGEREGGREKESMDTTISLRIFSPCPPQT